MAGDSSFVGDTVALTVLDILVETIHDLEDFRPDSRQFFAHVAFFARSEMKHKQPALFQPSLSNGE